MESICSLIFIIITLIINILSLIISSYIITYLIQREYRLREIHLLIVINTYIPIVICSAIHISWNFQVILGDTQLSIVSDSITCQIIGYIYLYLIICLFDSFSIQAFIRMLCIVYPTRYFLRSFKSTIIFISITWCISLFLIIPTIFLKTVVYQPTEYQCIVELRTWIGNIYLCFAIYTIPIIIPIIAYFRVVQFVRTCTIRNQKCRRRSIIRGVIVLRRIVILVNTLIILGLPSAFFWIHSLITGQLYYLTYRIQAFFLAVNMFVMTFAVALTDSQVKRLLPLFNNQRRTHYSISIRTQSQ